MLSDAAGKESARAAAVALRPAPASTEPAHESQDQTAGKMAGTGSNLQCYALPMAVCSA